MRNYGVTNRQSSLSSGALIGGVANFYTNTRPLTRIDGSALVIGDRWYNPSTQKTGIFNGTYFLDEILQTCQVPQFNLGGSPNTTRTAGSLNGSYVNLSASSPIFVESVSIIVGAGLGGFGAFPVQTTSFFLYAGLAFNQQLIITNIWSLDIFANPLIAPKTDFVINQYVADTNQAYKFQIDFLSAGNTANYSSKFLGASMNYRSVL